ncbi:MAG: ribonuclease E/G [Rhodospirillales bacterium]|nr:ribonuclease E/G [Rhodospirillales bacterium]
MAKRMLIDATHPEETRVVVVSGTRLEELDVETSTKKQLKGNIYLAKIVRVEPSLQAAFVDYGGNRHGFLAFSEIHPDYYQIPVADRQALLAEHHESETTGGNGAAGHEGEAAAADGAHGAEDAVEMVGGDDVEDVERRRPRNLRNYKIQEVIKRRQVVLVQVVKEERGNKGAALTTYLSLAGRYCVLMPNTGRGGGVSRKITSATDRRRLKSITNELDIPDGMAVIVRTAGSERSKAEIKRDYEYLLRLWDNIRELTLKSTAPALVYEEANLIKRSIRDLYSRDIEEILVEGDEGYRLAKDFMRMLTPSHARRVQPYRDQAMPLFYRFQVESQLDAMHSPIVQLKSGGYIVISPTEALVSIDVNSGRSTKERHIEETALKTNLEASDEIARQLRLRDLAGLIVIDFIDMEENRNNHAVERRLKEAMRFDRARIQLGRISPFGLLELSRQRLRPSLMETSFQPCTHCSGTGVVRSVESASVYLLRAIEEEGIRRRSSEVMVTAPTAVALYILNQKRTALAEIENRYAFSVFINGDDSLVPPNHRMERVKAEARIEEVTRPQIEQVAPSEEEEAEERAEEESEVAATAPEGATATDEEGARKRRKRRKRRSRRPGDEARQPAIGEAAEAAAEAPAEIGEAEEEVVAESSGDGVTEAGSEEGESRKGRRRGRRGGKRRRRVEEPAAIAETPLAPVEGVEAVEAAEEVEVAATEAHTEQAAQAAAEPAVEPEAEPVPVSAAAETAATAEETAAAVAEKPARPKRAPRRKAAAAAEEAPPPAPAKAETKKKAAPRRRKTAIEKGEAPAAAAPAEAQVEAVPAAEHAETLVEPLPAEERPDAAEAPAPVAAVAVEETAPAVTGQVPEEPPASPRRGWWRRPAG